MSSTSPEDLQRFNALCVSAEDFTMADISTQPPEDTTFSVHLFAAAQAMWAANDYATGCTTREDVVVVRDFHDNDFAVVRSNYRGLMDHELIERESGLLAYQARLARLHLEQPDLSVSTLLREKQRIASELAPDRGGRQGVESFGFLFTGDEALAQRYALRGLLSVAQSTFAASCTYPLGPERERFDLPAKGPEFAAYDHILQKKYYSWAPAVLGTLVS